MRSSAIWTRRSRSTSTSTTPCCHRGGCARTTRCVSGHHQAIARPLDTSAFLGDVCSRISPRRFSPARDVRVHSNRRRRRRLFAVITPLFSAYAAASKSYPGGVHVPGSDIPRAPRGTALADDHTCSACNTDIPHLLWRQSNLKLESVRVVASCTRGDDTLPSPAAWRIRRTPPRWLNSEYAAAFAGGRPPRRAFLRGSFRRPCAYAYAYITASCVPCCEYLVARRTRAARLTTEPCTRQYGMWAKRVRWYVIVSHKLVSCVLVLRSACTATYNYGGSAMRFSGSVHADRRCELRSADIVFNLFGQRRSSAAQASP